MIGIGGIGCPDFLGLKVRDNYLSHLIIRSEAACMHCKVLSGCGWGLHHQKSSFVFIRDGLFIPKLTGIFRQVQLPFLQRCAEFHLF